MTQLERLHDQILQMGGGDWGYLSRSNLEYLLDTVKDIWERFGKKDPNGVKTVHIRHISLKGDHNNNKMERINGEIRDREKVMRGLKRTDTPILKGYQLFHNYIRPHEALHGKAPADFAGIQVQGENKWLTLIQNASHAKRPRT